MLFYELKSTDSSSGSKNKVEDSGNSSLSSTYKLVNPEITDVKIELDEFREKWQQELSGQDVQKENLKCETQIDDDAKIAQLSKRKEMTDEEKVFFFCCKFIFSIILIILIYTYIYCCYIKIM